MLLLIYLVLTLIIALLMAIVVFNFARNRFQGDKTFSIVLGVGLLFILSAAVTLYLYLVTQAQ